MDQEFKFKKYNHTNTTKTKIVGAFPYITGVGKTFLAITKNSLI